jgi:hypothetical protein
MALPESIFAQLSGDTAVLAALGISLPATGIVPIYPNRAPDGQALPFVVFQFVAGTFDATHNDSGQFEDALYQFSIYAATYDAARNARKAIVASLQSVTALADGSKLTIEGQRDQYEPEADAHHLMIEARFFHDPTN